MLSLNRNHVFSRLNVSPKFYNLGNLDISIIYQRNILFATRSLMTIIDDEDDDANEQLNEFADRSEHAGLDAYPSFRKVLFFTTFVNLR